MSYSKKIKIPYMLCDRYENLSLRNLVSIMGDVSLTHSYILDKDLDKQKYRWIVYSWDIELINPVTYNQEIEVTTHIVDINKFYAHRNVEVSFKGELVARAYGVFLLIDVDRMRPIKMSPNHNEANEKEELIYEKPDLTYKKDFENTKEIMIRYTDIDSNFHVNNAVYFDYIYDLCKLNTKDIKFLNIVYKNEIRNKDSVIGEYTTYDNVTDYRLRSSEDDKIYTYGKIIRNV
ncbi:acyl-[acyl-carrier-protein] thioesterase [Anaerococcus sp. ENR0831]|uniref:Acyl-[acyl-carrier-protein] thioesterase n=1 Tax=Anaerococcus martiniensis TaxID=3115615 RepID=A0ABW9MA22_9FIRM